ncbi:MAG: fatty acid desaturase [Myxococcota bacterium]
MSAAIDLEPIEAPPSPSLRTANPPTSAPGSDPATSGRFLKYRADRRPVAFVCGMFAVHALVFFLAPTWLAALCVVPLAIGSMFVAPINHHHQHLNTFRAPWLNRIYDLLLALQTGIAPFAWVLHHNVGHHVNYLNQRPHARPDESKWTRRDGSQMGRVEYTIDLVLNHQIDIVRLGLRHRRYLRPFLWMKVPLWTILGLALWWNPINAFLAILLPGFMTLVHTAWATYEHHAGFYPTSHYDASFNNVNPIYNYLTCNLGLHTAHHMRPGVHWSLLPEIHAEILHKIPPHQIHPNFW